MKLYIYINTLKLNNQIYHCGSWFLLSFSLRHVLYLLSQILFVIFLITVFDVNTLRVKHLMRKM